MWRSLRSAGVWVLALAAAYAGSTAGDTPAPANPRSDPPVVVARAPQRWVDEQRRPTALARRALALLTASAADGLDPSDYEAGTLADRAAVLDRAPSPDAAAAFDADLTRNTLRYLHDLHSGRVDPRAIGLHISTPPDGHDYAALLDAAIAGRDLEGLVASLEPQYAQYGALRAALQRYRTLAADPRVPPPFIAPSKPVHPGDALADSHALAAWLSALGDLVPGEMTDTAGTRYAGALVAAVQRFQTRHGLDADGVIGPATARALAVPIARRVRQIELAMERLRWLPHASAQALVTINIPMFRLWAWDGGSPARPALTMGVIVGRAVKTETPVFAAQMTSIVFRPPWNVPVSIARKEALPAIARDAGYLVREDMEVVAGQGDNAPVVAPTPENLKRVRAGVYRLRQRPGPKNSLGLIKFEFPNPDDVYMHGTPARHLFGRARRDFSHGCVRVEDPVALAAWVLGDRPDWTRDRIVEATNATRTSRVEVTRPVQVILFYTTAVVSPDDGSIRFAEDIYGSDAALDRALAR
jgi:murein L,D-transpeptidase YcbB/YkuD